MNVKLNDTPVQAQRVFCVGMNYSEHISELGSKTPDAPVIFMKPSHSLVPEGQGVRFPIHGKELHFETELVILIGKEGRVESESNALSFIKGLTLGFDLTMRDCQNQLKKAGHPWELSKAFDDSAPLGNFVEYNNSMDIHNIEFSGKVNDQLRQQGNSSQMIFPVENIIFYIGQIWKLLPGDIIFTGTPPGVGPLKKSDKISAYSSSLQIQCSWEFI